MHTGLHSVVSVICYHFVIPFRFRGFHVYPCMAFQNLAALLFIPKIPLVCRRILFITFRFFFTCLINAGHKA